MADRVGRYFEAWYAYYPGSSIRAVPAAEMNLPGLEAFRVERQSSSPSHRESNLALVDAASGEVFVGDAFGDPARRSAARPFHVATDVPKIQASLAEAFGLPVRVTMPGSSRGPLWVLTLDIRQWQDAILSRGGYVSKDGSLVGLGEFRPLSESPREFRRRELAGRPGIRGGDGRFTLTEFLDFQCERCRSRAPEVEKVVAKYGGAVEARFLPLVRHHPWAFAAAECASALASIEPGLYAKYREAVFARAESLSEAACREIARDVAESASSVPRFEEEIGSGRARGRVLSDMLLASRLGVSITPTFVYDGVLVSGESGLLESLLFERLGVPPSEKKR
jgi:hypothetical protein